MNLVADEGVELQVVEALRAAKHHVVYVAELAPGINDDEVLDRANQSRAVLVTTDKDFGELVFRQGRAARGVVLLRLAGLPAALKAAAVLAVVDQHGPELVGAFTVVTDRNVRIRRL